MFIFFLQVFCLDYIILNCFVDLFYAGIFLLWVKRCNRIRWTFPNFLSFVWWIVSYIILCSLIFVMWYVLWQNSIILRKLWINLIFFKECLKVKISSLLTEWDFYKMAEKVGESLLILLITISYDITVGKVCNDVSWPIFERSLEEI